MWLMDVDKHYINEPAAPFAASVGGLKQTLDVPHHLKCGPSIYERPATYAACRMRVASRIGGARSNTASM
jgi:hypothetical protein